MSLVVDASVTVAWLLADEISVSGRELQRRVSAEGAIVPMHSRLEVANSLLSAARRGRYEATSFSVDSAMLEALPIVVDGETCDRAWTDTVELAQRHRLTAYDAAYLELALRLGSPLATFDRELAGAAAREGVEVL